MKKIVLILVALSLFAGLSLSTAYAMIYTFSPTPSDLDDLPHHYAYTWGIRWSPGSLEYITGAQILIDDIYNWTSETGDQLYVRLLDDTAENVTPYSDGSNSGDYFSGQGIHLFTYSDPDDNTSSEDLIYPFKPAEIAALTNYASNNDFGLSFDPDCHYYNNGIEFTIETEIIPEPATISLLGMSLLGLVGFRKRFMR